MNPVHALRHCVKCVCLSLLLFGLAACAKTSIPEPAPVEPDVRARLGNFTLASVSKDDMVQPLLFHKDDNLSRETDPIRELSPGQALPDFPLPGCETMKVEMFTGGANCCFGYYLLTTCPNAEYAAYIAPKDGGLGQPDKTVRAFPADDAAFFYYTPTNQQGQNPLSLSRVESPHLKRYIVFDKGTWRGDIPGEFRAAYKALKAQTAADKNIPRIARAISVAYYSLMAEEAPRAVRDTLRRSLPKQYAALAPTIYTDIQAAIVNFNPVQNLTVEK